MLNEVSNGIPVIKFRLWPTVTNITKPFDATKKVKLWAPPDRATLDNWIATHPQYVGSDGKVTFQTVVPDDINEFAVVSMDPMTPDEIMDYNAPSTVGGVPSTGGFAVQTVGTIQYPINIDAIVAGGLTLALELGNAVFAPVVQAETTAQQVADLWQKFCAPSN